MNKAITKYIVFFLLLGTVMASHAALKVIITKKAGSMPIAIVPFKLLGGSASQNVSEIIKNDLGLTGKFRIYDRDEIPSQPSSSTEVNGGQWGKFQNVLVGRVNNSGGNYTITAELLSVSGGNVSVKRRISKSATASNLRLRAHEVANAVFKELIGIDGVFDTKIAYISSVKNNQGLRITTLITADFDGHNPVVQRSSKYPLMSPSWSPDGKKLAYVMFKSNGRSAIYIQDVRTKKATLVSSFKGINGAPSFSPDGTKLALTLSRRGNPEIYTFNLRSRSLKRLTFNTAIDTEAVWTPDGRSLVFTSDRIGTPQLYKVSASGGRATRITRNGNYNSRASFSADGKKLTMVHRYEGRFNIGVMDLNRSDTVRSITEGRLDESPSFAPNGSMIIYASEYNRRGVLWIVSDDGKVKNRVVLPEGDIREPAWGPKR